MTPREIYAERKRPLVETYAHLEQDLLFGVLDALPCPAALLNLQGQTAYANEKAEALPISFFQIDWNDDERMAAGLTERRACHVPLRWPLEAGRDFAGVAELYPLTAGDRPVGALLLFKPSPIPLQKDLPPTVSSAMRTARERVRRFSLLAGPVFFLAEPHCGAAELARELHDLSAPEQPLAELTAASGQARSLDSVEQRLISPEGGSVLWEPAQELTVADLSRLLAWGEFSTTRLLILLPWRDACSDYSALFECAGGLTVSVPPLRRRPEDILPAAQHYLSVHAPAVGALASAFAEETKRALTLYDWPDNLRTLQQVVLDAALACHGNAIEPSDLSLPVAAEEAPLRQSRSHFTLHRIEQALAVHGRSVEGKRKAAQELGIGLSTLYRLLSENPL